jgi:hypothetical protein
MNRRTNDQVFDAVAGDTITDQTDIMRKIMAVIEQENHSIYNTRIRRYAILTVMIMLLMAIIYVPSITSAMRQWFGFIPGVGMVDPSTPIRVLSEPVRLERDGVVVTIEQVTALPDRTVVQYQVSNIPQSAYPGNLPGSDSRGFQNPCVEPLFLRLPNGETLTYSGYNAISGTERVPEYQVSFTVDPVPDDINEATLVMPCIEGTEREAIPGAWEFNLHLLPMPEDMQLLAVDEIPSRSTTQTETLPEPVSNLATGHMGSHSGIHLVLDQVVPLPDGDQLYGKLEWDENVPYSLVEPDTYLLTDSHGQRIPIFQISPDLSQMPAPGSRMVPLAFKLGGPVQGPGDLTLTVDRLTTNLPVQGSGFILDTDKAPNDNQEWLLDQDIEAGPYTIRVVSATRLADGYEFSLQTGPEIGCVDLYIPGTQGMSGMCGQGITRIQFNGDVPDGKLNVSIANLEVHLNGSWQVSWTPPETESSGK